MRNQEIIFMKEKEHLSIKIKFFVKLIILNKYAKKIFTISEINIYTII